MRTINALAFAPLAAGLLQAQPSSCAISTSSAPIVRSEGHSERTGDIILQCTGGTPTASGVQINFVNVLVGLNTNVSNRLLANVDWTDSLALIDSPGGAAPQLACGTPGTFEPLTGACAINGTGTGAGVYTGVTGTGTSADPGRPNIFQGRLVNGNTLSFMIPLDAPAQDQTRTVVLTNIRAAASALAAGSSTAQTLITATVFLNNSGINVTNGVQTLALSQKGIRTVIPSAPSLPSCDPVNATLSGPRPSGGTPQLSLQVTETAADLWRARTAAPYAGTEVSPSPIVQAQPASQWAAETGFYNPALSNTALHGNVGQAGLANQGTRLTVSFTDIPGSVSVFVPAVLNTVKDADSSPAAGVLRLISSPVSAFDPVAAGTPEGLAELRVSRGKATAVYEVLRGDNANAERADIPVYLSFSRAKTGDALVKVDLAPVAGSGAASLTELVPRFASSIDAPLTAFSLLSCR